MKKATGNIRRAIRKRNEELYGHREEWNTPNKNGHTPKELMEWYYLALYENRQECAEEWKHHITQFFPCHI